MQKKKLFFRIISIVVIVFLSLIMVGLYLKIILKKDNNILRVGKCKFSVEEARTAKERRVGLSGRDDICNNCGMLFYFDKPSVYGFWMKDMRFDLDILWIKNEEVIGIEEDMVYFRQETFYPQEEVDKVLEIKAGKVRECEIEVGQQIKN